MTRPLTISFEVNCAAGHAFRVWTSGIGTWWPHDHTVTGDADLVIVLEERVGGRIYERTAAGAEHDWGEVTVWDPPNRLSYRWHLGQDEADATEVDIRFIDQGATLTQIEIEHRGWDRLGQAKEELHDRNRNGWETLLPHFAAAVENGGR